MPANLTPDYRAAEAAFRRARDPQERLDHLREMLRLIPKHKGTDHLQADIKARIKELTEELAGPRKGAARSGPPTVIRPEGAAQVALVGPPNSGKSALHARLTGSHSASEPYPFATQYPQPGMLPVDDVGIQLVDLPSVSPVHPIPWIGNALQPADAALLVVDLTDPDCVDSTIGLIRLLEERRVHLTPLWDPPPDPDDPFAQRLPTVLVVAKADLLDDPRAEASAFLELARLAYDWTAVSAHQGTGLDSIGRLLFDRLHIVRVYTKIPGKPPDMDRPFTVRAGQSVLDVATLVHKEVAASLTHARLWRAGEPEGRQVGRDHPVSDGDVLELHH
ncbi:MAG: GTPase [Acidimicrobiia bacterium]|jgi:uncharacterized protein